MAQQADTARERVMAELAVKIADHKRDMAERFTTQFASDPEISGGQVTFRKRRVIIEFVVGLFAAGDDIDMLAAEYDLPRRAIEDAIRIVLRARGTSLASKVAEKRARALIGVPIT